MVTFDSKNQCRTLARQLRKLHIADARVSFLERLQALFVYQHANTLATYLTFGVEPYTEDIIAHAFETQKQVGIPAWNEHAKRYQFAQMTPDEPLHNGYLNIREPIEKRWIPTETYNVFLIPGLLFDTRGARIGYGRGFYDTLLANQSPMATRIALAFDWQVVESPLPQEPHDIPMDIILTPTRTITTR